MDRHKLLAKAVPKIEPYVLTALVVVCTLAIRLYLVPLLGDRAPYLFSILAAAIAKRIWGRGPALLAIVLGGISTWYVIVEPHFAVAVAQRANAVNLAAYFAIGFFVVGYLGEAPRRPPFSQPAGWTDTKLRFVRQTAVLGAAALVLAGMFLLLVRDFGRAQEAEQRVTHTHQVIDSAESLLTGVNDAEAGQRGYLLTGDASYLTSYNAAVDALPHDLQRLQSLTSDDASQQLRCVQLKRLIDERLGLLRRGIDLRGSTELDTALALVRSGRGVHSTDELRSTLDAVMREEHRLLGARTASADQQALRARWILGLGSGALVILLVFASTVIDRESLQRDIMTQALRRHAGLLEQAHDSLLMCRLRGGIEYWSHGAETLYGYTRDEALGRGSHELLQTDHPLGTTEIDARLERDGHWTGELNQITKDGRKLIVEGHWSLVVDADANKTVLEANRDITDRKRAEAERDLLATAIEQADETVVITDRDSKIQYVNPAFTRTSGYTRVEAVGQNPRVLKSGQEEADFYRELWATLTAGTLWRGEFSNRRKDGTLFTEQATITPVRGASGEITNYIAIKSDITERKRAEEALAESEYHFRQLFERSASAVGLYEMVLDAEGNACDYRYLNVNPAWERVTGLEAGQVLGRTVREVTPDIEKFWIELYGRVAATGEPANFEHYARHLGRYYSGGAYSTGSNQVAVTFMDLTERQKAEEEVRRLNAELEERVRSRTAALEAANRELESFAHSVSHDLRAPLRGIDGWSLALEEDYGERLDAQGHKYLEHVRSEAQRMGRLIEDMLQLSRISRKEMALGPVDLTALAGTISARLKEAQPDRRIEFAIAPALQGAGDARLLEVALTNLLDNAVKFTGKRDVARVEVGEIVQEGRPAYFVRDNGAGFDMAYAKMLFAPFQRLHKASEFPGTGIGLATVQRVIHRHGGNIWAESRVDAGTTVYFTLGEKP